MNLTLGQKTIAVTSKIGGALLILLVLIFTIVSIIPHVIIYAFGRRGIIRLERDEILGNMDIQVHWDRAALERRN